MPYNFDNAFQEKVAAHFVRDMEFCKVAGDLIEPEYFENETLAAVVSVQRDYWRQYNECPDATSFITFLKGQIAKRRIKISDTSELKRLLGSIFRSKLTNRQHVIDETEVFARQTAIANATLDVGMALDSQDQDKIDSALENLDKARTVSTVSADEGVSIRDSLQERIERRKLRAAGTVKGGGITTGIKELDNFLLPWRGFGRKEMFIFMGPPKSGKTAALLTFAINAATAGFNVYYASCEVSKDILSDRADSNISGIPATKIDSMGGDVDKALTSWIQSTKGNLVIDEFASGTLKVSQLRKILERHKSNGTTFDMVVVDYIDEMAPEFRDNDRRHDLAAITRGLRAISHDMDCHLLTATQTNREGTKNARRNVTDGTDVAEDYNKVRIADGLVTINANEDDKQRGEVVLYLSDLRNAESGIRLRFKQDFTCWRFITDFIGID